MNENVKSSSSVSVSATSDSSGNSSLNFIITKYLQNTGKVTEKDLQEKDQESPIKGPGESEVRKYKVGDRLAKGGMGEILNARDLNINRNVAMKLLLEKKQKKEDNIIRFIEEAQITGQLEHPGVVPVYELGINEHGSAYYTMKYIQGVTLKQIIKEIRNGNKETIAAHPLSSLLNILQKVCDAVAYAHDKGVIHRDLKPENIMIGDFGEVSVMDWGLAKLMGGSEIEGLSTIRTELVAPDIEVKKGEKPQLDLKPTISDIAGVSHSGTSDSLILDEDGESLRTLDGQILGTPNYMAPEQAVGQNDQIGVQTDIYTLGGILYNLLTLSVPISGKSFTEMMVNIVRGNIDPPSSFNPSSRKPKLKNKHRKSTVKSFPHCPAGKIPESLSAVAMKALALKPKDRYQDVKSFQKDIEAYQNGFATEAEQASLLRQVKLLLIRNKAIFTILFFSIITLITVVSFSFFQLRDAYGGLSEEKVKVEQKNVQLANQSKQLARKTTELEKTNVQLGTKSRELGKSNQELEIKSTQLERKTFLLQQSLDDLMAEKMRTEEERKRAEEERTAKEQERFAKEKEKFLRRKEEIAKEEEKQKREQVSKLSAPEFVHKSRSLSMLYQWEDAHVAVNTALQLDSTLSEGWYLKGRLLFGNLKFMEALAAFRKSNFRDRFGLTGLAEDYHQLIKYNGGQLTASELRELSKTLRRSGDYVLSDRLYQLALDNEKGILSRLNSIRAELQRLNSGLTDINYQYTISGDTVSVDLSGNPGLSNVTPLSGLPIAELNLGFTQVFDLSSLAGLPLKILHLPNGLLLNVEVLKEMPLQELHLNGKPQQDFNFIDYFDDTILHLHLHGFNDQEDFGLEFLKLVPMTRLHLYLHGVLFNDLNIFLSTPLTHLTLVNSVVTDISPLRYQKLVYLDLKDVKVKNIKAVRNMPLKHLSVENTLVRDIGDLKGKSLEYLSLKNTTVKEIDLLQNMPIWYLDISDSKVTDFSILRLLPLSELYVENLPIIDLQFLEGLKINSLNLSGTYISDIRILQDMPLTRLDISKTKVTNIYSLDQAQLTHLAIGNTSITDINVVKGMPLTYLDISNTPIKEIIALEGMHLNYLSLAGTEVVDLSPLEGMPINMLSLENCPKLQSLDALKRSKHLKKLIVPNHSKDLEFLKHLPSLEFIAESGDLATLKQTAAEFWEKHK